jgi:hypothetical protein
VDYELFGKRAKINPGKPDLESILKDEREKNEGEMLVMGK